MSILINENTKILVYGMTGAYGSAQVKSMLEAGSKVVAGVSAGKGGQSAVGLPVFDTATEAIHATGANAAAIYMPAVAAKDTITEAIESGIKLIFAPTEGIPVHDIMELRQLSLRHDAWIVGANSLGIISPGKSLLGSIAPAFTRPGPVGMLSRSGTLSLEVVSYITKKGFGESTVVSVGGDSVIGRNPIDYVKLFNADSATKVIVLLGEIGGMKEYEVCDYMTQLKKPLIAFIGGGSAKSGKRMGHMGAMIGGSRQDAKSKAKALRDAGAVVVDIPWDIPDALHKLGL